MKKIITAFIPLMMFSLVGCNKEEKVTYKEISEEQFEAYYTVEKKMEAINKLDSYVSFSNNYKSEQKNSEGKIYGTKVIVQVDEDYSYHTKRSINETLEEPTDVTTTELVLATSPLTIGSRYYTVVYDNITKDYVSQALVTGDEAFDKYCDNETMLRTIEKSQVENPIAIKLNNTTYYKGSDGTLKVVSANTTETMVYTYFIDSKTLFLKSYTFHEVGSNYELNQESIYKQNITIKHKTPANIGYKE